MRSAGRVHHAAAGPDAGFTVADSGDNSDLPALKGQPMPLR